MSATTTDDLLTAIIAARQAVLRLNVDVLGLKMDIATVKTQVAGLVTAVGGLETKIAENTAADNAIIGELQDLNALVQDLKSQLAAGQPVTEADLQAISDGVTGATTRLESATAALAASTTAENDAAAANAPQP